MAKDTPIKKDAPIKWKASDKQVLDGKPWLKANPKIREFNKREKTANWESEGKFGEGSMYAVRVRLIVGDRIIESVVADDLNRKFPKKDKRTGKIIGEYVKPHYSSILETRGRGRCIGMFSPIYTLDGEISSYDDVKDSMNQDEYSEYKDKHGSPSSVDTLTDDEVESLLEIAEDIKLLTDNWKKMSKDQQTKFMDAFSKKRKEIESNQNEQGGF